MKRLLALVSITAMLIAAPVAAFAVNVSSDDGSGTQTVSTWYGCGATTTGVLRSTSGHAVYYHGLVAWRHDIDDDEGRFTSDTSSTTAVSRGGTLGYAGTCIDHDDFQGVKVKICRNLNNQPDPCGGWSTIDNPNTDW